MKTKLFIILSVLLTLHATSMFANQYAKEIPLKETKNRSMKDPADKSPSTYDEIHAFIEGKTLRFDIKNTNTNHVIVHDTTGIVILNAQFIGDTSFLLPTLGRHVIELENGNLRLSGEFDQEVYNTITISPLYSITLEESCYIIDVEYPQFELFEMLFPAEPSPNVQLFNYISYEGIPDSHKFFYGLENGQPNMPFLSLNLQIPDDATIDTLTEYIEYYDEIYLNYPYAPTQDFLESAEVFPLQMDADYYSGSTDNGWSLPATISEPYTYMGASGINVHLRPILYYPTENILRPIHRMRYVICISGSSLLLNMYEQALMDENSIDAMRFFDTYETLEVVEPNPDYKGNFLIITTQEYEYLARLYAEHKNNLGYCAGVKVFTGSELEPAYIRNYIKNSASFIEWLEGQRLRYVLIIGTGIPFSAGEPDNTSNPLTDMYYACLSNNSIENISQITTDVYVGRWPVHNISELLNIIQKSITYDLNIPNRRMIFFSGTGNMDAEFAADNTYVCHLITNELNNITVINYDGRSVSTNIMWDEIEYNENLMLVYQGHGSPTQFVYPPFDDITSTSFPHNLPYFNIAYACQMGSPDGLGYAWVNEGERSCVFYGSAVNTYRYYNRILERGTFEVLLNRQNYTIGSFLYQGLVSSMLAARATLARSTPYILYGDPSLYIYGMELFGNPVQYSPAFNAIDYTNHKITYSIYSITGQLIVTKETNWNTNIQDDIMASGIQDGTYLLIFKSGDEYIASQKIIVQH